MVLGAGVGDWLEHGHEPDYPEKLAAALNGCPVPIDRVVADPGRHLDLDTPAHHLCLQAYFVMPFAGLPPAPTPAEMATDAGRAANQRREERIYALYQIARGEVARMALGFPGVVDNGDEVRAQMVEQGFTPEDAALLVPEDNPSPEAIVRHATSFAPHEVAEMATLSGGKADRLGLTRDAVVGGPVKDMALEFRQRGNDALAGLLAAMVEERQRQMKLGIAHKTSGTVTATGPRARGVEHLAAAGSGGAGP